MQRLQTGGLERNPPGRKLSECLPLHSFNHLTLMNCHPLPEFSLSSWESIDTAFHSAPRLDFGQHWQEKEDEAFRPGHVRLGWRETFLCFDAHLEDGEIFTTATRRNDQLYLLGDTLELFAGVKGEEGYVEYHFSPNNLIMQLFWPRSLFDLNVKAAGGITSFMREEDSSLSAVRWTDSGWRVCGMFAASALGVTCADLSDAEWQVSFGRYDYRSSGEPPVISSTSPHKERPFHRRHEWATVRFCLSASPVLERK